MIYIEQKCHIWNCNETEICTASASAKGGDRDVQEALGGSGREYVLVGGCADGTRMQLYVVHKGKNLWVKWMQGGPANSTLPYALSEHVCTEAQLGNLEEPDTTSNHK